MSEPLDPIAAGVATVLKGLRARAGLREDRLAGIGLALDNLTGLESVRERIDAGDSVERAIVRTIGAAVGTLEPTTYSIVADVSLGLGQSADLMPESELSSPDLGRRRTALLENWDRLHELRSAPHTKRVPTPRALRLDIETEALSALAVALTKTDPERAASDLPRTSNGLGPEPVARARGRAADVPAQDASAAARLRLARAPTSLLLEESHRIARALRDAVRQDDHGIGWPHDLRKGSKPTTVLSTSFGIKAMLVLEGYLAADLTPVAQRLRKSASPGGGYSARAQRAPRPEATAAVLGTLHRLDGAASFKDQFSVMKAGIRDFEKTRPFVLTTVLETSLQLGYDPELTRSLIGDLLAARQRYGSVLLWPEKAEKDLVAPVPSIAHTARAVQALAHARLVRSAVGQAEDALDAEAWEAAEQAAAWLAEQQDLGNVSEVIDRQIDEGVELGYVRHYTAAWVVKALVSVGLPASHPSVSAAVARIWSDYRADEALWRWTNGDIPVWMTLDAIEALRLAALANAIPVRFNVL